MHSLFYTALCVVIVAACIKPLGIYMARVYGGERVWLSLPLGWLERLIYRFGGIDPATEMSWQRYSAAIVVLGLFGFLLLYMLLLFQHALPMNPQGLPALSPDLAFNVAISFITNTNWQSYGGEVALSYFSQMAGITVQNFISAASGMAVGVALFRSLARKQTNSIGNAWVDVVRGILYILLPMAVIFALILASQGVVQTLNASVSYQPVETAAESSMAVGPVASQVAIKMLGSNGGGFFNTNSAHPFENPTPLSNFFQTIAILLIPAAFIYTFGVMVADRRQGWVLLAAMLTIFIPLVALAIYTEHQPNPRLPAIVDQSGGNMEGKEQRIGVAASALWAVATTATSNGSVNAMHDAFMPLTSLFPLLLMQFGEVIFGGVGSGAYGIIIYVLLTVFIGGLMVGRTPEYLGKKLGPFEIKMASLVFLFPAIGVLFGTALAVSTEAGRAGVSNLGAQGFSQVLYAFSSASNNNGSAMAGLGANTPFYNVTLGVCMFIGRYWLMVPVLALAGALARKNPVPVSAGTLPTHTPLFMLMLVGAILLLDVLTYLPALALGPVVEHMHLFHAAGVS